MENFGGKLSQSGLGADYKARIEHKDDYRTSIDIEVDLLAAKVKLEQQQKEIESLREVRQSMRSGDLNSCGHLLNPENSECAIGTPLKDNLNGLSPMEQSQHHRANELIRKSSKHVQRIKRANNQPQFADFKKKISSLANPATPVSILIGDSETNCPAASERDNDVVVDIAL